MGTIIQIGVIVLAVSAYLFRNVLKKNFGTDDTSSTDNEQSNDNSISFREGCENELNEIARNFGFLYEKTYSYLTDKNIKEDSEYLISEWEIRIKNNSTMYLIEAWKSIIKKYFDSEFYRGLGNQDDVKIKQGLKEWLDFLKELGIRRDSHTEIIIEDNSIHHIYHIDELWKVNDVLIVTQPAWFFKGKFVEKGIAKVKKE